MKLLKVMMPVYWIEKEINKLKELLDREKIRADFEIQNAKKETKKAAEVCKLLEAEKNKNVEKAIQIAKIEATKAGKLKRNAEKLASEMKQFKEAAKRFEGGIENRKDKNTEKYWDLKMPNESNIDLTTSSVFDSSNRTKITFCHITRIVATRTI